MMERLINRTLALAVLFFAGNIYAQDQNVIGAAGTYSETSNYSVAWTVGEPIITTVSSANYDVTQGFHQPDLYVVNIQEYSNNINISVYPNPARDIVNITSSEETELTLYDIQGKKIQTLNVSSVTSTVDVSYLSRGTYTLVFTTGGEIAKRMKIIIL